MSFSYGETQICNSHMRGLPIETFHEISTLFQGLKSTFPEEA